MTFRNFSPNEPNQIPGEDCLIMWEDKGQWNDVDCTVIRARYVCEKTINQ